MRDFYRELGLREGAASAAVEARLAALTKEGRVISGVREVLCMEERKGVYDAALRVWKEVSVLRGALELERTRYWGKGDEREGGLGEGEALRAALRRRVRRRELVRWGGGLLFVCGILWGLWILS